MIEALTLNSDSNVRLLGDYEIQKVYIAFIKGHKRNSERTATEYHNRVQEFFNIMLGKDIEHITIEDVKSITNSDVQLKFVERLLDSGNKNNTIVTKLRSVRSFYNELIKNNIQVNPMALKVNLQSDVTHHEAMTLDEYKGLLDFLQGEKDGFEKYMLTKMLYITANRRTATLNMKWDEHIIQKRDSITNQYIWIVSIEDKGGKNIEKPISNEFYSELLAIKGADDYVFPMMQRYPKRYERSLKKYGLLIGKNITIHSLKATSITIGYQMTKDINLVKQLGSHNNIATTEIYIKEEKQYTNQLSYNNSMTLDESVIDDLTHEELLAFLEDNDDIKYQIIMRLNINKKH